MGTKASIACLLSYDLAVARREFNPRIGTEKETSEEDLSYSAYRTQSDLAKRQNSGGWHDNLYPKDERGAGKKGSVMPLKLPTKMSNIASNRIFFQKFRASGR